MLIPAVIIGAIIGIKLIPAMPSIFVHEQTAIIITSKPTPTPTPSDKEVIDEIVRVFEPEGKHVVVRAINCFYSESGLRWDAVSKPNKNGTLDGGVAQINDVHKLTIEERLDYKKNIQEAYNIYKRNGSSFRPWYGKNCN